MEEVSIAFLKETYFTYDQHYNFLTMKWTIKKVIFFMTAQKLK
jgi:hypothetical protein